MFLKNIFVYIFHFINAIIKKLFGKTMKMIFSLCLVFLTFANFSAAQAGSPNVKFDSSAVWAPGMSMMQAIRDSCSKSNYPGFGKCFVKQMAEFGASQQAITFAKMTGNEGFMRDFKNTGKVDVAYSVFPFRANENQVCFLVNGYPNMINVDDYNLLSKVDYKSNKVYLELLEQYPNTSIWPGDRSGTEFPVVYKLKDGGQFFIFNYQLHNGCHACKVIGYANLGFSFNKEGKFLGVKIINIINSELLKKDISGLKKNNSEVRKIIVKEGKSFNIILESNRTTGYEWQIANTPEVKIVKFAGKEYLPANNGLMGAGGNEVWNFVANMKGQTEIKFIY